MIAAATCVWSPPSTTPKIRSMLSSRPRAARGAPALSGHVRMAAERTIVAALCTAEVLAMAGTMSFPALIPTFIAEWQLSHSEVGWISGISYGAYVAGVPVLVSLTDRIDARRIVIAFSLLAALSSIGFAWFAQGFWSALVLRALGGLALGGTYMPGLKADRPASRGHTGPLSVLVHGELLGRLQRLAVHHGRARRAVRLAHRLHRGRRRAVARGPCAAVVGASGGAGAARRAGGSRSSTSVRCCASASP